MTQQIETILPGTVSLVTHTDQGTMWILSGDNSIRIEDTTMIEPV
ncbi:hypothetical protein [Granulicella arctica]|nr:hypothetical protein [Granulicella arctica]